MALNLLRRDTVSRRPRDASPNARWLSSLRGTFGPHALDTEADLALLWIADTDGDADVRKLTNRGTDAYGKRVQPPAYTPSLTPAPLFAAPSSSLPR